MKKRLDSIEKAAWRLLCHEVAAAERENSPYLCSEAERVLRYFEAHGAPVLHIDEAGTVHERCDPHLANISDALLRLRAREAQ